MRNSKAAKSPPAVADSLNPAHTFLEPDPSFLRHNYDPYMKPIVEDVAPEVATRRPPSLWRRLVHTLSH